MAILKHHPSSYVGEYVAPALVAIGLVICLPLLGILLMLVRGPLLVVGAAVVAIFGAVALWRGSAPALRSAILHTRHTPK